MKSFIKTVFLIAVAIMTVGAVAYYAKTRLDPPTALSLGSQYVPEVEREIDWINPSTNEITLNRQFFKVHHLIGFLTDNQRLRPEESDRLKELLAQKYVPGFVHQCLLTFRHTSWSASDMKAIQNRVALIKKMVRSDGSRVVGRGTALNNKLDSMFSVTQRYEEARQLAYNPRFVSLDNSKRKISRANAYRHHDLLKYNVSLCDSLLRLPLKLERAHYERLQSRVEMLQYYRSRSEEDYDSLYQKVQVEIRQYADSANAVYGTSRRVDDLKSDAHDYAVKAKTYYKVSDWLSF